MRLRIFLMVVGALLVVATFTFSYWQPILENRGPAPVEAFPGLAPQLQSSFLTLPQEQQHAYLAYDQQDHQKALAMVAAALAPRVALSDEEQAMPEMNAPVTVASGTFQPINAVLWAQGTVSVYQDATNELLLRIQDLRMLGGPDLHVELSAAQSPATAADLSANGVDPLDVAQLQASDGSQNYILPNDTDLTQYHTVVIYSTSLDMVYSYAPLFVRQ